MRLASLLLMVMLLAGCDKLTGAADQKIADAEAIGFACRVSGKTPEDCMKENEAQSPSSVLDGWKSADEDIKSGKLDPTMKNDAAAQKPVEAEKPAEGEEKKDVAPAEGKKEEKAADHPKEDKAANDKTDAEEKPKADAKAKH